MRAGSVFTGLGGFDLAAERADMEIAWQVENDRQCNRVLERHWPNVPRYGDVREVSGYELRERHGPISLLMGGFPCQDLSVAGNRKGLGGERSGLWWEFARLLGELRPPLCLIENVPGLLSSWSPVEPPPGDLPEGAEWETDERSDFAIILSTLADLGYGYAWRVLDSQWAGLAQRRDRVFIAGSLGDWTRAAQILLEPESSPGHSPPSRGQGQGVAYPVTAGAGGHRDGDADTNYVAEVAGAITWGGSGARGWKVSAEQAADGHLLAYNRSNPHSKEEEPPSFHEADKAGASEDGTGRGTPLVAQPLRSNRWGVSEDATYTLDGANGQALGLPIGVRRLTPVEAARLQGFPDTWAAFDAGGKPISDSAQYKMYGNAVSVPPVEWILRRCNK